MISLKVSGMTCGHCEAAVRRALAAVPGVSAVTKVDHNEGVALVEGDAATTDLIAAIKAEGYEAFAA